MRELIVVRHGESEGNARGLAQGHLPFPLTPLGKEQAQAVARLIEERGWAPDLLVSSPVVRCLETAEILARALALPAPVTDGAFAEIDCGRATGRRFAELEEEHPEFFRRPASEWLGFAELGGESDERLLERVGPGLDRLPDRARVLLVTHGAIFKAVLSHLLGFTTNFFLDLRNDSLLRLERRRIGTGEVVALTHYLHAMEWSPPAPSG